MKMRFSAYLLQLIGVGCLAVLALLTANNYRTKAIAASPLLEEEFVDCSCGAVADGFDDAREVRTANGFGGGPIPLNAPQLQITQACQIKFSITPASSGATDDVQVYLTATVKNNIAANSRKVVRMKSVNIGGDTGVPPCGPTTEEYWGCSDPLIPVCDCPSDKDFYRVRVAFISTVQQFGERSGDDPKSFVLLPQDARELQNLIDQFGAGNILLGGVVDDPRNRSGWGYRVERVGDASLNTTVSIANPPACTGPGSAVTVTTRITNSGAASRQASLSSLLPAQLLALPGTCSANVGSCTIVNNSTVSYTGTLAPNQTAIITYQAQVADGTPTNTQLCISTQASVEGNCRVVTTCTTVNCSNGGLPGRAFPTTSEVSDQKAGSILFYNLYTSSAAAPNAQNTRITLTNTDPARSALVHLFFVDGASCAVADSFICLTANQTTSFLASDIDPGTTGYMVAVASDSTGCPISFNALIGDEYVKLSTGHAANLAAESFAAIAGGLPLCNANSTVATLAFDGVGYNQAPRVLAVDNIASRADGNDTLLVLNRVGGNLATGGATLTNLFGLLFDDGETPLSFTFNPGTCQFRSSISNAFPRTAPRVETFIPAGRSGWMKLWSANDQGLLGAAINLNANAAAAAGAFNQGHNLHKLRLTPSGVYTIPIFPPSC